MVILLCSGKFEARHLIPQVMVQERILSNYLGGGEQAEKLSSPTLENEEKRRTNKTVKEKLGSLILLDLHACFF